MPNNYELYDFQRDGVQWLKSLRDNGYGFSAPPYVGLLADEMGLGKTAQALETIKELFLTGKKILILAPGATIIQWQKQWDRWINDLEPDEFGSTSLYAIKSAKTTILPDTSYIMSHSMLASHDVVQKLIAANFDVLIIDEIHKFGGTGTKRIKHLRVLCNLSASKFESGRIGLSGTPVRNYAKEIYNIAHFLDGERFRNEAEFASKYLTYDKKSLRNPRQFHDNFAPYYLRRTVSEVQKSLPSIRRTKLYTEITNPFIIKAYNTQLDLMSNFMNNAEKLQSFSLLGYLIKLRHITGIAKAQEPAIIEPIREYINGDNGAETMRKAVIGFHHHYVEVRLKRSLKEFQFYVIKGGMSGLEKENVKNDFINAPGGSINLLSIKAAGEGIDGLQFAARKAYVFERQWNSADELQFEKRIHRTGQTQPVDIEYTIATGTVDEFFDEMVDEKRMYTTQVEDVNYATNPAFMKQLAERVISNRLPSHEVRTYDDVEDIMDIYKKPVDPEIFSEEELNKMLQETEYDILSRNEGEAL